MGSLIKNCLLIMLASLLLFGCADEAETNDSPNTKADASDTSDTSGSTSGVTDTSGSTSGVTDTSGSSSGDTSGSSSGDTSGSSSGDTSGSTSGDTSGTTTGECGDGRVDPGEDCDGAELGDRRCTDFGFRAGNLACSDTCEFDTTACTNDDPTPTCGTGEFTCADASCIPTTQVCNGSADCLRGEDEQNCGGRECQPDEYACADETCVPGTALCNGSLDCAGGEDEQNCGGGEVPVEWTCSAVYYDADDGCDCDCGAADPDCADPAAPVYGCATGQTCSAAGVCEGGGGGTAPAEWTCNPDYYAAADGCDCACGAYDTDCDDATATVYNCANGQTCDAAGLCTGGGGGGTAPPEWTCNPDYFAAADGCDCNCGAYDTDCDDTTANVYGCASDQTCDAAGLCTGGTGTTAPPEWTCNPGYYDNTDGCDCACGAYDPDCDDATANVYGCDAAAGETCNASGVCEGGTTPNVPAEWTCNPRYYDAADGCDCACGAVDPDCADPAANVYNCSTGQTCDAAGLCTGGGGGGTVPAEWTCNPDYYAAADGCDCNCGAYDTDCDDQTATIYGCDTAAGEICGSDGLCTGGGGGRVVPPGWTCLESYYSDGDCDCGCGAIDDVDCVGVTAPADCTYCTACGGDCANSVDPTDLAACTGGGGTVPAGWTCPESYYGDGDCDCGCGADDEDCTGVTDPADCTYCTACGGDCANSVDPADLGLCLGGGGGVPAEWTCNTSFYDAADGCDCACGAYDPDCDDATATVYNCDTDAGEVCSSAGECVAP